MRFLAFAALSFALPLAAQQAEISVSLRASHFTDRNLGQIGIILQPLETDDGLGVVGRLDLAAGKYFGHQLSYGYDQSTLTLSAQELGTITMHQFFYDFVAHALPRGSRVRPFVVAGLGFSSFFPPSQDLPQSTGSTQFGLNYGGGVKFRLTKRFGLRVDVRDHVTSKPDFLNFGNLMGKFHQIEYSGGVSFLF